jgi:predicted DNA-binding transcriptional regulator YafY
MRLHRLVAIILLIESRGQIKARELADALETSVRTIHRDIDVLCESGIPITSTTGPSGGIKFMDGYKANISNLHCDDVVNLFLSGIGIHPDEQSEASINLKNALLKLETNLPQQYQPDIRTARERFYFDPSPWWKEKAQLPFLDILRKSL